MKFLLSKLSLIVFVFILSACGGGGGGGSGTTNPQTPTNALPTADAGSDQNIPEGSYVSLFGNGSDTDGNIVSGAWSQISGTAVSFTDGDQLDAGVSIPSGTMGETLVFSLEVTDNEGGTATDEVSFIVDAALAQIDYTGDEDPDPLSDVTIDVAVVGTSSLVPASMGSQGYNTIMVNSADSFNFHIEADSLLLIGSGAPPIAIGDVIVGVIADESAGYARKVIDINGGVYTTVAATLNQAFPDAEINLDISLANGTVTTSSSVKGSDGNLKSQSSVVDILSFNRTLQHEIRPGVKTVAELKMNSAFNVNVGLNILSGTITKLSTIVSANYSTAAYLDVNLSEKYSRSTKKEFKPIFDKSKVILISGFPVLVNVKAVPVMGAGINMSAAGTLKYGFKVGGDIRAGFEYANDRITNIAEFNPYMNKIGPDYTLAGGLRMNAQASIGVIVTLYDINVDIPFVGKFEFSGPGLGVDLGPYAKFKVGAKYDSQANPQLACDLDLSVGINSDLSIDYGTLGSQLNVSNPKNINLYNLNKSLWNADVCPFGTAVGDLVGTVTDSGNVALSNVTIEVKNDAGTVIANVTSQGTGVYQIDEIAIGAYDVYFSKQGYKEAVASLVVTENITTVLPVVLVGEGVGVLQLSVMSETAPPDILLAGAEIIIREGLDNPNGDYVTTVDSEMTAIDIPLDSGYYTLEIVKDRYEDLIASLSIENAVVKEKTTTLIPDGEKVFGTYDACFIYQGAEICHPMRIDEGIVGDNIAHFTPGVGPFAVHMDDYETSFTQRNTLSYTGQCGPTSGIHYNFTEIRNYIRSLDLVTKRYVAFVYYDLSGCDNEIQPSFLHWLAKDVYIKIP